VSYSFLSYRGVAVTGTEPWITRIAQVKSALAVNIEAERKVDQLNHEMQNLVRSLKTKDQTIQESGVKIELMERRMEAMKKQADTIVELENELIKGRKQERAYEEAMEQLQADLDTLEQDNAKSKSAAAGPERQGKMPVYGSGKQEVSFCLQLRELRNKRARLSPSRATLKHPICSSRSRHVFMFAWMYNSPLFLDTDRGFTWHGSLPANGELLSQRPRPTTRNSIASSTAHPPTDATVGSLWSFRFRGL
jgi:TolA-binding protein